MHKTYP